MKSYFTFSKGQKIGVVTLAVIIIIQILFLNKGSGISIPDPFVISAEQYRIIDSSIAESNYKKNQKYNFKKDYKLVKFDPNNYSSSDWKSIGFSEKQANIIVNYKNKIGGFKKKSDIEKVFVISEKKYKELKPFLNIKEMKVIDNFELKKEAVIIKPLKVYELNSASIIELISISGIGEFTAKGIIKHKDLIGGFHSISQLKEIYGIENDNYDKIIKQLEIDNSSIIKINVNELSIFELKKHHYISWSVAEAIINKRLTGKLSDLNFLVGEEIITSKKLKVILPYVEY
jgi:DNA uptake protein ComE-like DNA-binding protein